MVPTPGSHAVLAGLGALLAQLTARQSPIVSYNIVTIRDRQIMKGGNGCLLVGIDNLICHYQIGFGTAKHCAFLNFTNLVLNIILIIDMHHLLSFSSFYGHICLSCQPLVFSYMDFQYYNIPFATSFNPY